MKSNGEGTATGTCNWNALGTYSYSEPLDVLGGLASGAGAASYNGYGYRDGDRAAGNSSCCGDGEGRCFDPIAIPEEVRYAT